MEDRKTECRDRVIAAMKIRDGERISITGLLLRGVEVLEPEIREEARKNSGVSYDGVRPWRTPGGSGQDGHPLYLLEEEGAWALAPKPVSTAPRFPTVASYMARWWRADNVARDCIERYIGGTVSTTVDTVFGRGARAGT